MLLVRAQKDTRPYMIKVKSNNARTSWTLLSIKSCHHPFMGLLSPRVRWFLKRTRDSETYVKCLIQDDWTKGFKHKKYLETSVTTRNHQKSPHISRVHAFNHCKHPSIQAFKHPSIAWETNVAILRSNCYQFGHFAPLFQNSDPEIATLHSCVQGLTWVVPQLVPEVHDTRRELHACTSQSASVNGRVSGHFSWCSADSELPCPKKEPTKQWIHPSH